MSEGEAAAPDDEKSVVLTSDELPAINLPPTRAAVNFNQQVNNYQQIPPSAWDGLTPEQRLDLSKSILGQLDVMDKRHFDFAMDQAKKEGSKAKLSTICGLIITVAGFSVSGYLALHGQPLVGLSISTPLATILAIVVGNRFISPS